MTLIAAEIHGGDVDTGAALQAIGSLQVLSVHDALSGVYSV